MRLAIALVPLLLSASCAGPVSLVAAPSLPCSPQASPAAYGVLAEAADTGVLVVRLKDAAGAPRAGATVSAGWSVPTGTKCARSVLMTTDAAGEARFERMVPGPYRVSLVGVTPPVSQDATLAAGQTLTFDLVAP